MLLCLRKNNTNQQIVFRWFFSSTHISMHNIINFSILGNVGSRDVSGSQRHFQSKITRIQTWCYSNTFTGTATFQLSFLWKIVKIMYFYVNHINQKITYLFVHNNNLIFNHKVFDWMFFFQKGFTKNHNLSFDIFLLFLYLL